MRCVACNAQLTDFEATRKSSETEEFLDLCNHCYSSVANEINSLERYDLMHLNDEVELGLTNFNDEI